jgi:hypothetical protein
MALQRQQVNGFCHQRNQIILGVWQSMLTMGLAELMGRKPQPGLKKMVTNMDYVDATQMSGGTSNH